MLIFKNARTTLISFYNKHRLLDSWRDKNIFSYVFKKVFHLKLQQLECLNESYEYYRPGRKLLKSKASMVHHFFRNIAKCKFA